MEHVCFIVRHKPTGNVIPPSKGFDGRGGSHVEPSDSFPRLFRTERAAKGWLTTWLKGKVVQRQSCDPERDAWLDTIPVETRKRDEMEIVKARLTI